MEADVEERTRPWIVGELHLMARGPGPEVDRTIRVPRPFATVGRGPGSDVRVDDPTVEDRHVLLLLNRRGVFGVDLRTRSGTRFPGKARESAWLGAGDSFEVAGRRIELAGLRVDGSSVDPPRPDESDDPLADAPGRVALILEPVGSPGPAWMIGSALAFAGRGEACAVRVEHPSVAPVHCGFYRTSHHVYLINMVDRSTSLDGRPVVGASTLLPGDILTLGEVRFAVRVERGHPSPRAHRRPDPVPIRVDRPGPVADPSSTEAIAWLLDRLRLVGGSRRGQERGDFGPR